MSKSPRHRKPSRSYAFGDVSEVASRAARRFDVEAVPFSFDPDEFAAAFNGRLLESVESAVSAAGYDLDADEIFNEVWDATMAMEPDEIGSSLRDHEYLLAPPRQIPIGPSRAASRPLMRRGRRSSRGRSTRVRGSRRCSSRSNGGGSSGDPDDGEPARGRHELQNRVAAWVHS
jgi:hypothetical protein